MNQEGHGKHVHILRHVATQKVGRRYTEGKFEDGSELMCRDNWFIVKRAHAVMPMKWSRARR